MNSISISFPIYKIIGKKKNKKKIVNRLENLISGFERNFINMKNEKNNT